MKEERANDEHQRKEEEQRRKEDREYEEYSEFALSRTGDLRQDPPPPS